MNAEEGNPRAGQATGVVTNRDNCSAAPDAAQVRKAAAWYIRQGWHPIPLRAPEPGNADSGKIPLPKGWQNARTAAADIPRLWPDGEPRNIGITCGPSRLVVLDFDTAAAFAPWAAAHPDAVQTFSVKRSNAPEGRLHLYFTLAEGQPAPAQLTKAATGWGDLKSAGGQVVAPPSIHYTGGRYEIANMNPPLPWRDTYTPALHPPGIPKCPNPTPPPQRIPTAPRPDHAPGIPPSVQALIDAGAGKGARNETAFKIATQLRDEGLSESAALGIVSGFARRCTPPLPESETARTVRSAYAGTPREPARDPNRPAYTPRTERTPAPVEQAPPPQTPETEWPEPAPLGGLSADAPRWPWECFPEPLRRLGEAIQDTINAAPELVGLALLAAASIACRKLARVQIKRGHYQFPNLYALAALHVGHGKTPVAKPILRPLIEAQQTMREAHRGALRQWEARSRVAKAQVAALERQAGKADGDTAALVAKLASLTAIEAERPAAPVLFLDNATSEAMARTLAGNRGSLGVFSADGRDVLAIARGRYSKDSDDVGVWLKGHAGDYLAFHRAAVDKPSFECVEPILAAFLAVQIDALQTLGAAVTLRESGFLARFLYVVPPPPDSVEYPTASIPPDILEGYGGTLRALLAMPPARDPEGEPCPHLCRLGPDAFEAWKAFHDATKRAALSAPPLLAQCLNKMPEHLARLALVFHLVECATAGRTPGEISAAEIERAATVAECLKEHARRAVALMGETVERATARQLWPALERNRARLAALREAEGLGPIEAAKPRDVARFGWGGIEDTEQARAALDALEVKGWLRLRNVEAPGARPHVLYELHPHPRAAKEGGDILI